MVPEDVAQRVFDGMPPKDVVLDKEVQHGFDSHGLLRQLAQWLDEKMQCKQ